MWQETKLAGNLQSLKNKKKSTLKKFLIFLQKNYLQIANQAVKEEKLYSRITTDKIKLKKNLMAWDECWLSVE